MKTEFKSRRKIVQRCYVHNYCSGATGILRVILRLDRRGKPASVTVGHESFSLLAECDAEEYQRAVLTGLATAATELDITFVAPIPGVTRELPAKAFLFSPKCPPVQLHGRPVCTHP